MIFWFSFHLSPIVITTVPHSNRILATISSLFYQPLADITLIIIYVCLLIFEFFFFRFAAHQEWCLVCLRKREHENGHILRMSPHSAIINLANGIAHSEDNRNFSIKYSSIAYKFNSMCQEGKRKEFLTHTKRKTLEKRKYLFETRYPILLSGPFFSFRIHPIIGWLKRNAIQFIWR